MVWKYELKTNYGLLKLKITPKIHIHFSHLHTEKWVSWKNKHDDPMFSLHEMIAYMLPHIILRFEGLVNFEKELTSIFWEIEFSFPFIHQHIYTFFLYYYNKMMTNLSNAIWNIFPSMYTKCLPWLARINHKLHVSLLRFRLIYVSFILFLCGHL